jgi:uncharacterized protein YyaL (SSP411 family)
VKTHAESGSGEKRQPNRLINETSTYLQQHAYNPVDWFAWGPEAIAKAKELDRPILLSVGYSACHWCHVMEHESFEDQQTADVMNKLFICIKVDREERPDIDEIYMKAVQMLTGHGGWPMTVFLTPQLKPFFGGTYYPPEDRHGLPGFKRLLLSVAQAWEEQRDNIEESSAELTEHLSKLDRVPAATGDPNEDLIQKSIEKLWGVFDKQCGGFGGAPKFPHTGSISLAMRQSVPRAGTSEEVRRQCLEIVSTTLDKMAYGGIHDQIGGGFARYAVDRIWLVPHFEKMLYDNALLCRNYMEGYQLTGRKYWSEVGRGILEFTTREMTTPEGAFYSSLDADSEGEEGKFYVWTPEQIKETLGDKDAAWACEVFGVSDRGNFEHGASVLHLAESPEVLAKHYSMTVDQFWHRLNPLREKLLQERSKRIRPGRDEKVLTSWNSLMISAFVDGYRVLQEQQYLDVARKAAAFILDNLLKDGKLLRTWGRGHAKLDGYLDDYAYFIQALLDLAAVDFDGRWYENAVKLNEVVLSEFNDDSDGGFFYTSHGHEQLITRTKNFFDASTPSPTSVATMNLIRLSRLTGRQEFAERAKQVLKLYSPYYERVPDQFSYLLCDLDFYLSPESEIAFIADSSRGDSWRKMLFTIYGAYLPNSVVLTKDTAATCCETLDRSPLLQQRGLVEGKPTVYICQNYTCEQPITTLEELEPRIRAMSGALPKS